MAENLGASFSIDVTALKAGLAQANRLIRESESQFKAAAAGMDDWRKSQQGLEAKIKSLNTVTDLQQKKVDALTAEYDSLIAGGLDPASAKAVELRTKINKETEALEKSKAETKKLETALDDLKSGADDAENAFDDLGDSAEESGKDAEKASDGFTVMKGAISSLVADGIKSAVSAFGELIVAQDKASSAFQSQTGASASEMEKWNEQMQDLYANNYGEDLQDIADSMAQVARSTQETDPDKIKDLTRNAIALRDTFGYEVNESIRAAKALMTNFGVSGDEAFNLIAQGAQDGLDYSNELIDSINEYSVQFKKVGLDADDMFNIFADGAKSGAWNLDKVGDAVKEFSIRAIDGSNTTREAYKALGYDADEMMQTFVKGGDGARDAFRKLINKLIDVDDQVARDAIGVGLFGTMWEDLGVDAVKSLATTNKSITKTSDTMKKLDEVKYDNVGDQIAGLGREFKTQITEQLNKKATPAISNFIKKFKDSGAVEKFGKAIGFVVEHADTLAITIGGVVLAMKGFAIVSSITTAVKGLTGVFGTLNAVMSANPIGAVVTALGLLVGIIGAVSLAMEEAKTPEEEEAERLKSIADETNELVKSRNDLAQSVQDEVNKATSQFDYYANLRDELSQLVDANGKVKEGYEKRVDFILNELKNATGEEAQFVDGIIKNYDTFAESIDTAINKQRAQIILEGQKELYDEAVRNKNDNIAKLTAAEKNWQDAQDDWAEFEKRRNDYKLKQENAYREANKDATDKYIASLVHKDMVRWDTENATLRNALDKKYFATYNTYEQMKTIVEEDLTTIAQYEADYAAIASGNADEIAEINNRISTDYKNTGSTIEEQKQAELDNEKTYNATLLRLREEGNSLITQEMIDASNARIKTLEGELEASTSTIDNNAGTYSSAWGRLADAGVFGFGSKKGMYTTSGADSVSAVIGGMDSKKSLTADEMDDIAQEALAGYNSKENQKGFVNAGANSVSGINSGASSKSSYSGIWNTFKSLGAYALGAFMKAIDAHSPSRAFAKAARNIPTGIVAGIKETEGEAYRSVENMSNNLVDIASGAMNNIPISGNLKAIKSGFINARQVSAGAVKNASGKAATSGNSSVVVNQYNTYSQAHSRYELYKTKQQTAAAVRLAVGKA